MPVETLPRIYANFPVSIDPQCRDGTAKLYDECGDQLALFREALARANSEGKVLLVSYGAEWCVWCHVFDAHINGDRGAFRYTYAAPDDPEDFRTKTITEGADSDADAADELREFVARTFVVAHIDYQYAPNGDGVLEISAAAEHFPDGLPFIFVVDSAGQFVASVDSEPIGKSTGIINWYRGYDRRGLQKQLGKLRDAALAASLRLDAVPVR